MSRVEEVKKIREEARDTIKNTVPPLWKKVGHQLPKIDGEKSFSNIEVLGEGKLIEESYVEELLKIKEHSYLEKLNIGFFNSGIANLDAFGDLEIKYNLDVTNNELKDLNIIRVKEGKTLNLSLEYSGDIRGFRSSYTLIEVERNAKLNLLNLQLLGGMVETHNSIKIIAHDRSEISQYNFEIGGEVVSASSRIYLNGDGVRSKNSSIYIADKAKKIDLEYSNYHEGRHGESSIEGRGIVKDKARKIFRGNLYFERGSIKSVGKEEEIAILMSKEAKSYSVPTLFCKEDDVIGEHAASAGKLNDDKLFYLMSRGIDEVEAKRLVAISNFKPIIEKLKDQELKEKVLEEVEKRL